MPTSEQQIQHDTELIKKRALQIHRGAARAAVLGINDGLVSTLCIVLAVAAAQDSPKAVLTAGFAGLVAGAVSMAAGEWISIKSQISLFKGVIVDLKQLVKDDKQILIDQLEQNYEEGGIDKATAIKAANEISHDDQKLMHQYAKNVMGVNLDELGSPWTAAFSSFALFTAGALIALFPWFFATGQIAAIESIVLTSLAGLIVGGYVSRSSGGSIVRGALRQLAIIILASIVTYGVGHLFGTVVE